jgi:hypothetical protein
MAMRLGSMRFSIVESLMSKTFAVHRSHVVLTRTASAIALALGMPLVHADCFSASDFPSLVLAINAANAADSRTSAHTITLSADITLGGQLPPIFCNVTIDGQGHALNGADLYRLLFVGVDGDTQSAMTTQFPDSVLGARLAVTLSNLTLAHGNAAGGHGSGEGGGGMGAGGALFVGGAADVTLQNVDAAAKVKSAAAAAWAATAAPVAAADCSASPRAAAVACSGTVPRNSPAIPRIPAAAAAAVIPATAATATAARRRPAAARSSDSPAVAATAAATVLRKAMPALRMAAAVAAA